MPQTNMARLRFIWQPERNRLEVVKSLLECGADVNSANIIGCTPLHSASNTDHFGAEILKMLLSKGACLNSKNKSGCTPLHLTVGKNNAKIAGLLLEWGSEVNMADNDGDAPLHTAISRNVDTEIVQMLLSKGACADTKGKKGETLLHLAVGKNNTEIAGVLLEWGSKVNIADNDGCTPLHTALYRHADTEMVQMLLSKVSCVNAKDRRGETPLHYAVKNNKLEVVKLLFNWGADLNVADGGGSTPLHMAVKVANCEFVELLLVWGADVNAENKNGATPLGIVDPSASILLKRHVIMLTAANIFVSDKNLKAVYQDAETLSLLRKCEKEVKRLKDNDVCSGLSFFDVWMKNVPQLARLYAGTENVFKSLTPVDVNTRFPIYGRIVNVHLSAFLERKELLECGYKLFSSRTRLPSYCIAEIFGYLSNEDLKRSHEVFCNESWV